MYEVPLMFQGDEREPLLVQFEKQRAGYLRELQYEHD